MKCAGVGGAKFPKNTHVPCGSVRSEKLLCAECAGVPKLAAHKYSDNLESLLSLVDLWEKSEKSICKLQTDDFNIVSKRDD